MDIATKLVFDSAIFAVTKRKPIETLVKRFRYCQINPAFLCSVENMMNPNIRIILFFLTKNSHWLTIFYSNNRYVGQVDRSSLSRETVNNGLCCSIFKTSPPLIMAFLKRGENLLLPWLLSIPDHPAQRCGLWLIRPPSRSADIIDEMLYNTFELCLVKFRSFVCNSIFSRRHVNNKLFCSYSRQDFVIDVPYASKKAYRMISWRISSFTVRLAQRYQEWPIQLRSLTAPSTTGQNGT